MLSEHAHQHLEGGLTRQAAYYPPGLVLEILRGIRDTYDLEHASQEENLPVDNNIVAQSIGFGNAPDGRTWAAEFRDRYLACAAQTTSSTFKCADGTSTQINWDFKDEYKDQYTSEVLPKGEIRAAIVDEMS